MGTVLFTAHPARGHLNPLLAIARRLRQEGHTVAFATPNPPRVGIERLIRADDFRFFPLPSTPTLLALALLPFLSGYAETFLALRLFLGGLPHYARAVSQVIEATRPQAVVAEFFFPGAGLAAEMRGTPHVTIYHAGLNFPGPGIPPYGSGLPIGDACSKRYIRASAALERSVDRARARARRRLGLPPANSGYLSRPLSPWLNLALTAEAIEAPRDPLPPNTFFVGPCPADSQFLGADGFPREQLSSKRPRVYLSFGTVFNRKPGAFRKVIDALGAAGCQLIVSAGAAYGRLRAETLPANVLLFEQVPQVALLPYVDAVITHGGNNTVNETLAAGKPMLVLPVGGEQGDNAARVVYLGAGLRADWRRASQAEIAAKARRLLAEPTFRRRAGEIAAALARLEGPCTAARFIAHVAGTQQPLRRPPGYPLTVTRGVPPPWEFGKEDFRAEV